MKNQLHSNLHYAIQNRLRLELNYNGEGVRLVEPYCFGRSKAGNYVLRVYQIEGYTTSIIPGWKLLDQSKISDLKILADSFDPTERDDYQVGDKSMETIFIQIY
jgi:hypothetical protein